MYEVDIVQITKHSKYINDIIIRYLYLECRHNFDTTCHQFYIYFTEFPHCNYDKPLDITRYFNNNIVKAYELCKKWKGKIYQLMVVII